MLAALVTVLACLAAGCTSSQYAFESNKKLGVYLKVPKTWTEVSQDALFPLYEEGEKQGSREAYEYLKEQIDWEKGWDSSPKPDLNHFTVGKAEAPVVRVMVRTLAEQEARTVSFDGVANLALASYTERLEGFRELLRNPGTSELVNSDFVPLQNLQLMQDGFFGVRQLFEARNPDDSSLYAIAFIGLVNVERTRLYTLTMHCNRRCYVANQTQFTKVLDSFTVRKP